MATKGRNPDGTFAPGHQFSKGRPPRNYSIAHSLSIAANQPQTIDDDGNPLTDAQLAAKWLWEVVRTGLDRRKSEDGDEQLLPVSTRDRMEALKTILSRIEPEYKLTDKNMGDATDEELEEQVQKLDNLTDEELAVLEKLATGKGGKKP